MKRLQHYDYIFIGLGASSCLLIHELDRQGLLIQKKTLVIEPSTKAKNDKTYCFWSEESDDITKDYASLASHHWSKICIDNHPSQDIDGLTYYHINSIDLYNSAKDVLNKVNANLIMDSVESITAKDQTIVSTGSNAFSGEKIFDARPPAIRELLPADQNILQSFVGYKVVLKETTIQQEECTLMNFNVPQQGSTQFVYILPFSENSALFELTRFGVDAISEEESKEILESFILDNYGLFEIEDIESGVIPMFMDLQSPQAIKGVIPIGTRANQVKPSTGYAFKNMYEHAKAITKNDYTPKSNFRFQFYDRILILILALWPHQGKPIFQRLFEIRKTAYVLRFLDEKTSIWQDIKMFYQLPLLIFLKSFIYLLLRKAKSTLLLFGSLALYFSLQNFIPEATETIMYTLLIAGLVIVGIPHGAMDHLTKVLHPSKQITIPFILKYLGLMAIVYLLWLFSSDMALLSFLLYSAWHFGQTDLEDWRIDSSLIGFIWGTLLFIILFSSHLEELQSVLILLEVSNLNSGLDYSSIFILSILTSSFLALKFKNIQWLTLIAFLFLSQWLPLIISFGIYFIFHHSYKGWSHLKQSLGKSNLALFKVSLPFNMGAFILFLFFFLKPQGSFELNTSLFFVFISCISFPHIVCMHKFYKLRKKNQ